MEKFNRIINFYEHVTDAIDVGYFDFMDFYVFNNCTQYIGNTLYNCYAESTRTILIKFNDINKTNR